MSCNVNGRVASKVGKKLTVEVYPDSACGQCKAGGVCGGGKSRTVVFTTDQPFAVGDEVTLYTDGGKLYTAVISLFGGSILLSGLTAWILRYFLNVADNAVAAVFIVSSILWISILSVVLNKTSRPNLNVKKG